MILIISEEFECTTDEVVQWLLLYNISFLRVNKEDYVNDGFEALNLAKVCFWEVAKVMDNNVARLVIWEVLLCFCHPSIKYHHPLKSNNHGVFPIKWANKP